jgi:hypothetical protein
MGKRKKAETKGERELTMAPDEIARRIAHQQEIDEAERQAGILVTADEMVSLVRQYAEQLGKYWNVDILLDETEKQARAIYDPQAHPKVETIQDFLDVFGHELTEQEEDAVTVLAWVRTLRAKLADNDKATITLALKLGALAERMGFRLLEPYARQAIKAKNRLVATAKSMGHGDEKIQEALSLYHNLRDADPDRKIGMVQREVEKQTGVSARTLRYHLKKQRSQQKPLANL